MSINRKMATWILVATALWVNTAGLAWGEGEAKAESLAELREKNILFWSPAEQLIGYPNIRHLNPVSPIHASSVPLSLQESLWFNTETWLDAMETLHLTGLLVIEGQDIRFESYRLGHGPEQRWMSFSIAKSVVALLYGVALRDGAIASLDDPVKRYLSDFEGTAYGEVPLHALLQMSSGIQWNEDYEDDQSDVARLDDADESEILAHLKTLPKLHPPGTVFNYNTGETILAGAVLAEAVGQPLATYLTEKVWQPFGMAQDADWARMGPEGGEMGGCCISATLRDYGRMGLFALRSGQNAQEITPLIDGWMATVLTPADQAPFYGYFWWLSGDEDYYAVGIFGQMIYVSPSLNLVIAMHGAWPRPSDPELSGQRMALIESIKRAASSPALD